MSTAHPRWRLAKKILTGVFFIAVAVLLVLYAQKVNWDDVWKVIRDYNRTALLSAIALVIVSYLIYGCYDLMGRAWCGHKLAKRRVMLVSFICYAFNLTLSAPGGRHRHALPALFPAGAAGQHHHTHFLIKHYHQLAGLHSARWADFLPSVWCRSRRTGISMSVRCALSASCCYW